jgi:ABC-type glycerol-3-phosphate transport system substrate-binding protein
MSSTSRITLGLIQVAFGSLLLGDSFWSAGALADWKKEWEKTLAGAKKEGQVVLLMRRYEGVFAEFRKEYPEIKVVTITGRGSDLGNRIVAERRAGKFLVDIYVGGPYTVAASLMPAKAVDPISDVLFLPEVVDESKWITGKHRYTDPERKYNFAFVANPGATQISYNTNLVDPKKFDSYRDLLDPK